MIGRASLWLPTAGYAKPGLYCNLRNSGRTGGPERFLHNLASHQDVQNRIPIHNLILNNCSAALVFSASWGDTFTDICQRYSIRTVLRVDGFYVPSDQQEVQGGGTACANFRYKDWVNNRLERDLERFDHVIYQSEFSKQACDQYLFARKSDFSIIHNGVNLSHFIPSKPDNTRKGIRLVVLGKHYPEHLELALAVFSRIQLTPAAQLLIIGPMRDDTERVGEFVKANVADVNLLERIECRKTVSFNDLPGILKWGDIFLHVKIGDWCPNAVLEAMSCGLPVVCPAWGGTRELVGNAGIAAPGAPWRVDESLVAGMASAVNTIQADLADYKKKARARAMAKFDINAVLQDYLDILGFRT